MAVRQLYGSDELTAEPRSVDMRNYWLVVKRRWRFVVLFVVIGLLGAGAYAYKSHPSYVATAQVVITAPSEGPLNQTSQPAKLINTSTEQAIAQSSAVAMNAARIMKVPADKLLKGYSARLTVTVPATADLLQVAWKAPSPKAARAGANAFADAYLEYRHALLEGQAQHSQQVLANQIAADQRAINRVSEQLSGRVGGVKRQNLSSTLKQLQNALNVASSQQSQISAYDLSGGSVIPASLPTSPSGISRSILLLIGLVLGLVLGVAFAFLRDVFDDRIGEADQFERKLGAPVLAELPGDEHTSQRKGELAVLAQPGNQGSDGLRALRATLLAAAARADRRTLLVVSADPAVSSARLIAQIGLGLAESGRKVLLVAADTQSSALARLFDVPDSPGLAELLASGGSAPFFARKPKQASGRPLPAVVSENLSVLPAGDGRQTALLDSAYMSAFLRERRAGFDIVMLESPPVDQLGDVVALASQVEGVIVIARTGQTTGRVVSALRHRLDQVGTQIIGGVLMVRRAASHRAGSAPVPVPAPVRSANVVPVSRDRDEADWNAERPGRLSRMPDDYGVGAGTPSGPAASGRLPKDGRSRPPADTANRRP